MRVHSAHFLAVGLKDFDATLIVPVFQCFFITCGIVAGGVFFDEFSYLKAWEQGTFAGGVVLTLAGVYLLAQREQSLGESRSTNDLMNRLNSASKIIPEVTHVQSIGQGSGEEEDSLSNSISSNYTESSYGAQLFDMQRPDTPMPMSIQYHSLAMRDLYHALREGLSTPERRAARAAARRNTMPNMLGSVPENAAVGVDSKKEAREAKKKRKANSALGIVRKGSAKKQKKKKKKKEVESKKEDKTKKEKSSKKKKRRRKKKEDSTGDGGVESIKDVTPKKAVVAEVTRVEIFHDNDDDCEKETKSVNLQQNEKIKIKKC